MKVTVTYILWSSDFPLYFEDYLTYVHHTLGLWTVWPKVWPKNKCRSLWPIFYGPVILSCILETIWCMNIIIWDYESVWPKNRCRWLWPIFHGPVILRYILKIIWFMNIILCDNGSVWPVIWPQNKCRSLWSIFYGPVILPDILKTIWCMYISLRDYESVWPEVWPQNKCRSLWPIFYGSVILSWRLFDIWRSLFGIMVQYDLTFNLKINVGLCNLYFMVQWFCLIFWWRFIFGITS